MFNPNIIPYAVVQSTSILIATHRELTVLGSPYSDYHNHHIPYRTTHPYLIVDPPNLRNKMSSSNPPDSHQRRSQPQIQPCRYKTGKTLGAGSYSVVKECVHVDTGRYYAAKVINKRLMAGREHMVFHLRLKLRPWEIIADNHWRIDPK